MYADFTFAIACAGETFEGGQCSDQCRDNLTAAYENIGCCAFSFYAVSSEGLFGTSAIFSFCTDVPQTLCIGGASGETLSFPTSSVAVDPLCEDLVDNVASECRSYLGLDPFEIAFTSIDTFCDSECGEEIYDFQLQCDERTGTQNATFIDLLCARNDTGTLCGYVFSLFTENPLEICTTFDGLNCSSQCRNAITHNRNRGGCCVDSLLAIEGGTLAINQLYFLCGLEASETCVGAFSDEPIEPRPDGGDQNCRGGLQMSVPIECLAYTSYITLFTQAVINPEQFYRDFCNSHCSDAIYEYFLECDTFTLRDNAASVDFLCSTNADNVPCAGIYSDLTLFAALGISCSDTTDTFCSEECSNALQEPVDTWGCCLFTLAALENHATFVDEITRECRLPADEANVCIGGITGEPVAVNAGDDRDHCEQLHDNLPRECETDLILLGSVLFSDPERVSEFCDSECAVLVYEYIAECGVWELASYIDLACTSKSRGSECARLLTDASVGDVIEGVCAGASDVQCSSQCSVALQELNDEWGCCLYTLSALATNATYTNDFWSQCGVDDPPGVCEGELSGERIDVTGDERDAAVVSTAVSSTMLVFIVLIMTL